MSKIVVDVPQEVFDDVVKRELQKFKQEISRLEKANLDLQRGYNQMLFKYNATQKAIGLTQTFYEDLKDLGCFDE
jgi:hypothetical protein